MCDTCNQTLVNRMMMILIIIIQILIKFKKKKNLQRATINGGVNTLHNVIKRRRFSNAKLRNYQSPFIHNSKTP